MGHQGTLGIATRATLKLYPKPEAELSAVLGVRQLRRRLPLHGRAGPGRGGHFRRRGAVRRVQGGLPAPGRRGLHPAAARMSGPWSARCCTAGRTRSGSAASGCSGSPGSTAPATSATRSPRATGRPGTTGTPPRCTAGPRTVRWCPMSWHCEDAAINYTDRPGGHPGLARDRRRAAPQDRRLRRLGHVRLHLRRHRGGLPDRDRRRDLGAAPRRRGVGAVGQGQARHRRGHAATTAVRSAPATARAGRARSTSCPASSAAASTVMCDVKRTLDPNNIMNPGKYLAGPGLLRRPRRRLAAAARS